MNIFRIHLAFFVAGVLAFVGILGAGESPQDSMFYVAPNGQDANPGTREQPFKTLAAARDAAREAEGGPHRVVMTPGEYFLTETFDLDSRDNGLTIEAEESGKVTVYGGTLVTGWRRDGERFWRADVTGVKEGQRDFRALVVDGRMPQRARFPESGTFTHRSTFDVRWMTTAGGGWQRKPTPEELTTMLYDPKDLPATLDVKNAEIRVYHMWGESLVRVAENDTQRHALVFSSPTGHPPGGFRVKKYVVWNTREGMTRPGQWYLDRTAGRIVYWPLPDEDMSQAKVIAPSLERIIRVAGTREKPVEKITIRGLTLQATTTPLRGGGFGAGQFDGALRADWARQCVLEGLEICNVGGQGIWSRHLVDCQIVDCHIHHTGACGLKTDGASTLVSRNQIHNVGACYPSAIALWGGGRYDKGLHIYRNEIHDAPYSGIICGGDHHRIEENLIYRVMREMHDGGAIYCSGGKQLLLRGNVARDIVEVGKGYGASAYYLDEQCENCIVERNVSVGVPRPTHNHMARDNVVQDNVFITEGDMTLSFSRSAGYTFRGNTLFSPGKIIINQPGAVTTWEGNVIFRDGLGKDGAPQPFTINHAMPPVPEPKRKTWAVSVGRAPQPPAVDGDIQPDEWPGDDYGLDRDRSRQRASGPPAYAELSYDDQYLYVGLTVVVRDTKELRKGSTWKEDDGAEVCIAGKTADGKPVTFVVRGYAGGSFQSVTDAGAPAQAAKHLGDGVRYAAKAWKMRSGGGWRGEWAIPLNAMGLKPTPGSKIAFNIGVFRSECEEWACWEGTLAENWRLDEAGTLQFK